MKNLMDAEIQSSAEPCAKISKRGWYCVRTQPKHEHIAAAHLLLIPGVDVFNPQLRLMRSTRRGRRWCTESLFPNYVFAQLNLESGLDRVSCTLGVKEVLRFGGRIPEIPESVVRGLQDDVSHLNSQVLTDAPVQGDEVEIMGDAFVGVRGEITRLLPGGRRAQILLDVMGRMVPAELNLDAMLIQRKDAAQIAIETLDTQFSATRTVSYAAEPCI